MCHQRLVFLDPFALQAGVLFLDEYTALLWLSTRSLDGLVFLFFSLPLEPASFLPLQYQLIHALSKCRNVY